MSAEHRIGAPEAHFDFLGFAQSIYREKADIHREKYLLPALYGGQPPDGKADRKFKAMVVLEAPSLSFTEKRWRSGCQNVDDAIDMHRQIFFDWAQTGDQAALFRLLAPGVAKMEEFFQTLYITDVWKDALFAKMLNRDNPTYGNYWRSKLRIELESVPAERVVLVGRHARTSGYRFVPLNTPVHLLDFPGQWLSKDNKHAQIESLEAEIQSSSPQGPVGT